jgi:hypothetical protein
VTRTVAVPGPGRPGRPDGGSGEVTAVVGWPRRGQSGSSSAMCRNGNEVSGSGHDDSDPVDFDFDDNCDSGAGSGSGTGCESSSDSGFDSR